jgi:hypothetical protein
MNAEVRHSHAAKMSKKKVSKEKKWNGRNSQSSLQKPVSECRQVLAIKREDLFVQAFFT